MSAFLCLFPCGLVGNAQRCPPSPQGCRVAGLRGRFGSLRRRRRAPRESWPPLGPFEDGDGAVGIVVDPDPGAHKVRAQRRGRDLQLAAAPGDAVVVADDALLLDREDVAPERLGDHDEGRGRLLGRDRKGPLCSGR